MRVIASGNLTVELIRAQRFDVACRADALEDHPRQPHADTPQQRKHDCQRVDKVQLSSEAIESDPWALPSDRSDKPMVRTVLSDQEDTPDEPPLQPERLSPVVGSPALAGLGAAWVVPGTLLDVVA